MGLFRKTMSLSTMGLVDYRDHSERAAAAERSKSKAYRQRTKELTQQAELDRAQERELHESRLAADERARIVERAREDARRELLAEQAAQREREQGER